MATAQAERDPTRTAATAVFAVLVLATVGAVFVTQRLKREKPVVREISLPVYISPNDDGRKDSAELSFLLPRADRVTVSIVDAGDDEVRRLADDRPLPRGTHRFRWDGRDAGRAVPEDGIYYLRVSLGRQGRATTAPRGMRLVTARPVPKIVSVTPARVPARGPRQVTIEFEGPTSPPPVYSVYRTGAGAGEPRLVARFAGKRGTSTGRWTGRDLQGRPVPPGTYAVAVTVQNRALVSGSAPRRLPPTVESAVPHTGVTVAGPEASGPLEAVLAGSAARVRLRGATGRVRYRVTRPGAARPLRRGRARAPALRIPIPRKAPTGLYTVRLSTNAGPVAVPLAIRGRGAARARVLVVLPAISWQGLNPVDDDGDGFPDTLREARSVGIARPLAAGRLPAALGRESRPLLELLARGRRSFDLTTDLALARGNGPPLRGRPGVVFAGSALWLTEALGARLRSYVEDGGRVASFGTDAFRRTVRVTPTELADATPAEAADVFGERTTPAASAAAPLVVDADALALFAQTDGYVGLFTQFEQQQELDRSARLLSAAGRDPKRPAFVAYRLGRGTVVRAGTPEWARATEDDAEVAAVTEATWDLLSR